MSSLTMTGLTKFIAQIRKAQNTEAENKIVEDELKKIKSKFISKKSLSAYDRKKYVLKLLYIKLLGYRVDFGYKQVLSLIQGVKYSEIYAGCISASGIIPESEEDLYGKVLKSITSHLFSPQQEVQTVALAFVGGLANKVLAQGLVNEIMKLALGESSKITTSIRKKVTVYRPWFYSHLFFYFLWIYKCSFMILIILGDFVMKRL